MRGSKLDPGGRRSAVTSTGNPSGSTTPTVKLRGVPSLPSIALETPAKYGAALPPRTLSTKRWMVEAPWLSNTCNATGVEDAAVAPTVQVTSPVRASIVSPLGPDSTRYSTALLSLSVARAA